MISSWVVEPPIPKIIGQLWSSFPQLCVENKQIFELPPPRQMVKHEQVHFFFPWTSHTEWAQIDLDVAVSVSIFFPPNFFQLFFGGGIFKYSLQIEQINIILFACLKQDPYSMKLIL